MIRRRLTTALLSLLLSIVAFAAQKNLDKDITMVTYEQGWMDTNGALSLKNNTGVEVKNVVFLITYLLKTEDIHPPKTGISVHFSGSLV